MNQLYYDELAKLPTLSNDKIDELFLLLEKGDKEASKKIIEANLKLVVHYAKYYQKLIADSDILELEDLISSGNIGLIKAVEKFNLSKKTRFSYYAGWWIKKEILDFINANNKQIKVPRYNNETAPTILKIPEEFDFIEEAEDENYNENIYRLKSSLQHLEEREKDIIEQYFGIDKTRKTLEQIGTDYGISKARIKQIKDAVLEKIKKILK